MRTMVSTAGTGLPPVGSAATPPDELAPGAKCGPWVVERELGRGGMGAVYAVHHEDIGKRAALKIVHARLLGSGFNPDRMMLEAKVVNQVGHPGIVDIFETGQLPDGRSYIVMERLEGKALSSRCDEGKLPARLAVAVLEQVSEALIAAHDAGIVHRDLKLDNVFLVETAEEPGVPATLKTKLLDWGIAKVINTDVRNTMEGQLVGTPQYLSPEQARGQEVSAKTDVYSLGVMAYELFTDVLPFEAETVAETMTMHLRATPQPPRDLEPTLLPALEHLVLAMLEKAPRNRPDMRDVLAALHAAAAELARTDRELALHAVMPAPATMVRALAAIPTPVHPARTVAPVRRWHLGLGAGAAVAVVALVMLAGASRPHAVVRAAAALPVAAGSVASDQGPFIAPPPVAATPVAAPVSAPAAVASAAIPMAAPFADRSRARDRRRLAAAPVVAMTAPEPIEVPGAPAAPRPRAHASMAAARTAVVALPTPVRRAPNVAHRAIDPDATVDAYQ